MEQQIKGYQRDSIVSNAFGTAPLKASPFGSSAGSSSAGPFMHASFVNKPDTELCSDKGRGARKRKARKKQELIAQIENVEQQIKS